jgi:hypothetical protein
MSGVDSSLRRLGPPVLVIVVLTGYAVVALGISIGNSTLIGTC